MKKLVLVIALLLPTALWAFDFSVTLPGGNTLYFDILPGGAGAKLVYPNSTATPTQGWSGYAQPTGSLLIPSAVENDNSVYAVVEIGRFALYGCSGLTSIEVPESVESIDNSAFNMCTGLTQLYLPSAVTSLGSQTVGNCTALTDLWIEALTPPAATYAFYNTPVENVTLHVPAEAYTAYSTTAPWSTFGSIVYEQTAASVTLLVNNPLRGTVIGGGTYPLNTLIAIQATPTEGCFFACWSDGDTVNPRAITVNGDITLKAMFFEYLRDSAFVPQVVYDTVWREIHDTVVAELHIYDTVYQEVIVHDTLPVIPFSLQVLSADNSAGVGVGTAQLPLGTTVEICGLPLEGHTFLRWSDGNTDNPRTVTITGAEIYIATFGTLGIPTTETSSWNAVVDGQRLTVNGRAGEILRIYDVQGRLIFSTQTSAEHTVLTLPAAGAYLVCMGDGAAKKIVCK